MSFTFVLRNGSTAQWAASNRVLLRGEPGFDTDLNIHKFGDGIHTWANLPAVGNASVEDIEAALEGIDVLTAGSADAKYLRVSATAGTSVIPTGGSLITYGDSDASTGHYASILGGAHSLTGWPGTSDANKRLDPIMGATAFSRHALRTVPYSPHASDMVILRLGYFDQGSSDWTTARSGQFQRSLRTMLALLSAESRVEETDAAFTYSGTWGTTGPTDSNWSAGGNKFGSATGAFVDIQTPAGKDTFILHGASNNATGAQFTITDHTAGDAVLDTVNTAATLPTGVVGPVAWRVPEAARGHVIRFTRTGGAVSLTIDGMLPQASNPPLIVFIKNHYLNDYTTVTGATAGTNARIDEGNALADAVLAQFPNVKVISTQADSSWVTGTHVTGTGYTPAGHARMAALIEAATGTPGSGTAGLTKSTADTLYAPIGSGVSVSEGPLKWGDSRIGGIVEDPSLSSLTDQTARWNTAMGLLADRGGELHMPAGAVGIAGVTLPVPGGAKVSGEGFDYSQPAATLSGASAPPRYGSVLRATAAMDRLVQLGETGTAGSVVPGKPGGSIYGMSLDGRDLANTVVRTAARRNFIDSCQVYWGLVNGVHFAGQNSYMVGKGVVAQHDLGDCVRIDSYFDHKVFDWELREMGPTGAAVRIKDVEDVTVSRIHTWAGANGVGKPAQGLIVVEASDTKSVTHVNITDNILEGVIGPTILLKPTGTGFIRGLKINGTNNWNNDCDGTFPVIKVEGSGGTGGVANVVISGNTFHGKTIGAGKFTAFIEYAGTIAYTTAWDIGANSLRLVQAHILGTPPDMPYFGGAVPTFDGTVWKYARREGQSVQNGGGSAFTIAHGLSRTPRAVTVTPGSIDAADAYYITSDATNITVTFKTARSAGTGNVVLNWSAAI